MQSSIGDAFAIAGFIERIVAEVKSYKEAPQHFQRLAIELDHLSRVCHQAFRLRPSSAEDRVQVERIRAIALQCLGPLKAFGEKMRGYESTLGPGADLKSGKKVSKTEQWCHVKKRLHWSASIAPHEVDQLRAILTSEISAINALLGMQTWQALQDTGSADRAFAAQLTCLMDTTKAANQEIRDFLITSKTSAERMEAALTRALLNESERARNLNTIQATAEETSTTVGHVARDVGQMSSQLTTLFSLTEHLEKWIGDIVQYCKGIIGQVRRNTDLLLSLHGLFTRLELALRDPNLCLGPPVLAFENPFGVHLTLPYQMCDTWEGMCRMLSIMFVDKPGYQLVERGLFVLLRAQTDVPIDPATWSICVAPGDKIAMSMAIERARPRAIAHTAQHTCPRCEYRDELGPDSAQRGSTCPRCSLWWSDTIKPISESTASLPRPFSPQDLDISCFRRIHVVRSQSNMISSSSDRMERRTRRPVESRPTQDFDRTTVNKYLTIYREAGGDPEKILQLAHERRLEVRLDYWMRLTRSMMERRRELLGPDELW
ncbi:hypothetical protein C8A05DRAFT_14041 [Staphylotrichum tortipilum]|uniref:Fungal N-terminal domain-containing protein n=1 Tax=Staphylotrichum tortipilum TaxID=2831512 RepID=A0AAN6MNA6_9PEZI|nr:hypothetical protein C8A05DRAFT_14041 [Staphylotrichum longicolle]